MSSKSRNSIEGEHLKKVDSHNKGNAPQKFITVAFDRKLDENSKKINFSVKTDIDTDQNLEKKMNPENKKITTESESAENESDSNYDIKIMSYKENGIGEEFLIPTKNNNEKIGTFLSRKRKKYVIQTFSQDEDKVMQFQRKEESTNEKVLIQNYDEEFVDDKNNHNISSQTMYNSDIPKLDKSEKIKLDSSRKGLNNSLINEQFHFPTASVCLIEDNKNRLSKRPPYQFEENKLTTTPNDSSIENKSLNDILFGEKYNKDVQEDIKNIQMNVSKSFCILGIKSEDGLESKSIGFLLNFHVDQEMFYCVISNAIDKDSIQINNNLFAYTMAMDIIKLI